MGGVSEASPGLRAAVQRVGDRWSLLIVDSLLGGPRRFGDLQGSIVGLAPNVLAARLRQLDREGLLVVRPYSKRPPRMEYELSGSGRELAGALRLLASWGASHHADSEAPRHGRCGTPLEVRWWCPTCGEPVELGEEDELRWI